MNTKKCPICEYVKNDECVQNNNIDCNKCGNFTITRQAIINFNTIKIKDNNKFKVSSWISEQNKIFGISRAKILADTIDIIVNQRDKTVKEKFNCFIQTLPKIYNSYISSNDYNHCYIWNDTALELFYEKALEKRYIKKVKHNNTLSSNFSKYKITLDGLEYIESLSEINKNSKNIFVAFYFTNELQNIFDNDIKSAIEELGFNYIRVSSSSTDTDTHINDDIIGKIKSSKIVIADFTGQRNSVYFEAGFAMGLKVPVIWSCKEDEVTKLSFDTRQYPHILWNTKEEFVEKLVQRIKILV